MGFCNMQPLHCPYKAFTTTEKKMLQERKVKIKWHYQERQSFEVWLVSRLTGVFNCTFLFSFSQLAVKHHFNYVSTGKRRVFSFSFLFQLPCLIAFSFKPKTYGGSQSPVEKQFIVSVTGPHNSSLIRPSSVLPDSPRWIVFIVHYLNEGT